MTERHRAYFKGQTHPLTGQIGIGVLVLSPKGDYLFELSESITAAITNTGTASNNVAEHQALIALAQELKRAGILTADIYGDSQLVVNQVNGLWRVKEPRLRPLRETARELLGSLMDWSLTWIPKERNQRTHDLAVRVINQAPRITPNFERVTHNSYIAHGKTPQAVDLASGTCTCSDWVLGKTRPCKHLLRATVQAKRYCRP